jgi:LmbE family N-acetylglucosaminyl deacetylase
MPAAIAIAAHPDDIEFCMAGTLLLLRQAGWEIHYFNLSTGNCGSLAMSAARTRMVRRREAQAAARCLQARWHPPISDDLEITYHLRLLRQVAAVIRQVRPTIILTHSPVDYMEDHMSTSRLAVGAAFARGMPNFRTVPPRRAIAENVTVYHAMPHGLRDGLRRRVMPGAWVNTASVHAVKRQALAAHRSQKEWLDASQGMDSYLHAMDAMSAEAAQGSRRFKLAEGWRRHLHLGFSGAEVDPLADILGTNYQVNRRYEADLA